MKGYRDWYNIIETAKQDSESKGKAEGKLEGIVEGAHQSKIEMVKNCILDGMEFVKIARLTGLSESEIEEIYRSMN